MATAPDGSPGGAEGSPAAGGIDGAALAMRMVQAAEAAAAAAQATSQLVGRQSAEDGKSWWKLLPKPPVFDYSSRELEISNWKEWSWTFEQYIASVDAKFLDDIQGVRAQWIGQWTRWTFQIQKNREKRFSTVCCHHYCDRGHCLWSNRLLGTMDWRLTEL